MYHSLLIGTCCAQVESHWLKDASASAMSLTGMFLDAVKQACA
ncbi:hypothetical protein ACFPGO_01990 [Arcanobacterium canis]|uniref:Uncharacterized protein n=1 Tax=Arcanobacterium canis TaxID=999183 RepID=A0ABY8FXC9_9ACTO|nr:hypothetical protein [Arcanobacterium canis]WFM82892.1 hypothetical protein P7079_05665 [Arcanobacterium canis]